MIELLVLVAGLDVSEAALTDRMNWIADNSELHILETTEIPTVVIPGTYEEWFEHARRVDPEEPHNLAGHYDQYAGIITMNPTVGEGKLRHEIAHHMQYNDPTADTRCPMNLEVQAYEIEIAYLEQEGLDTTETAKLRNEYKILAAFICSDDGGINKPHHLR